MSADVGAVRLLASCLLVAAAAGARALTPDEIVSGDDAWGCRPRHPALINEFGRTPDADEIRLDGEWDFSTYRSPQMPGFLCAQTQLENPRKINVPSCWEAQGVGEPGTPRTYACTDSSPKAMRHCYEGAAIYRREVKIPAAWADRRVWIKSGPIWSQGWIYVNAKPVAWLSTYCGTYKWEITDLARPGETVRIDVVADNSTPNRAGSFIECGRLGGIVYGMALEATPRIFIDDAWVRGDFDKRLAEAHVEIEGISEQGTENRVRVTVEGAVVESKIKQSGDQTLEIRLWNLRPWSPEHPNLYTARIDLVCSGQVTQTRFERFGVRKFEVRGKDLFLNGIPFFLRGTGDNHPTPLTGSPPVGKGFYLDLLKKIKSAGFNYVRFHTHCPFPEYFEAADEIGVILQPELPYYQNHVEDPYDFDPMRDARERWRHFRRYVSWGVSSQGNEGVFCEKLRTYMYNWQKAVDPDRFINAQDGGGSFPNSDGSSYTDFHRGARMEWEYASYNAFPFVCHEYLNVATKFDVRTEGDFSGLWLAPGSKADRRAFIAKSGLDETWDGRLQDAQHAQQAFWIKYGLEAARTDPYCDGYCFWTVTDSLGYNPKINAFAGQGLFDAFCRPKPGGLRPSDLLSFNSSVCLTLLKLDDLPTVRHAVPAEKVTDPADVSYGYWKSAKPWPGARRVYVAGETIPVEFRLANYGERPLRSAEFHWRFELHSGGMIAEGRRLVDEQPVGPAHALLKTDIAIPEVRNPARAVLVAEFPGAPSNHWDFWLLPKRECPVAEDVYVSPSFPSVSARYQSLAESLSKARIVIAEEGSEEAQMAIAGGKDLITLAGWQTPANVRMGWWDIGKQCGTAVIESPLFGDLSVGSVLSPFFFRLFKEGTVMPVAGFSAKDAVVVCEGATDCRLHLAMRTLGSGARHVFVSGLDVVSDYPEGSALLDAFIGFLRRK